MDREYESILPPLQPNNPTESSPRRGRRPVQIPYLMVDFALWLGSQGLSTRAIARHTGLSRTQVTRVLQSR